MVSYHRRIHLFRRAGAYRGCAGCSRLLEGLKEGAGLEAGGALHPRDVSRGERRRAQRARRVPQVEVLGLGVVRRHHDGSHLGAGRVVVEQRAADVGERQPARAVRLAHHDEVHARRWRRGMGGHRHHFPSYFGVCVSAPTVLTTPVVTSEHAASPARFPLIINAKWHALPPALHLQHAACPPHDVDDDHSTLLLAFSSPALPAPPKAEQDASTTGSGAEPRARARRAPLPDPSRPGASVVSAAGGTGWRARCLRLAASSAPRASGPAR